MADHYTNRPENTMEGYKCSACGFMWASQEAENKCPACGFLCNPYCCRVVDASDEDY